MNGPVARKRTLRHRIGMAMYDRGWRKSKYDGSLRSRIAEIFLSRWRWYDWGHVIMTLVGREDCGNYSPPRVRDMWFKETERNKFEIVREYRDLRDRNDGEWRVFDAQDDGHTIIIGYYPGPFSETGNISRTGLNSKYEQRLFTKWLLWEGWVKAEWFGFRRWLYYKALHAAVAQKIPFSCQASPPEHSGGYRHWHCQLKKRHKSLHRFHNYTWGDDANVIYRPVTEPEKAPA